MKSNSSEKIGFLLTVGVLGMSLFLSWSCKSAKGKSSPKTK